MAFVAHVVYSISTGKRVVKFKIPEILLLGVAITATVYTYIITVDGEQSYKVWTDFMKCIILYFLIVNIISTKRDLHFFLFCILLSNCIISYDYVHNPSYSHGRPFYYGSHILGDPNEISLWLISCLPLSWALLLATNSRSLKIFYFLPLFIRFLLFS